LEPLRSQHTCAMMNTLTLIYLKPYHEVVRRNKTNVSVSMSVRTLLCSRSRSRNFILSQPNQPKSICRPSVELLPLDNYYYPLNKSLPLNNSMVLDEERLREREREPKLMIAVSILIAQSYANFDSCTVCGLY
jgi:hypothetical protein